MPLSLGPARHVPGVVLLLLLLLVLVLLPLVGCAGPGSDLSAPEPAPRQATVVMNGDLLWHNTLVLGAAEDAAAAGRAVADELDFAPLLAGVRPVVESADLAICHNEVPVAAPGGPYRYYPAFAAPVQTLDAVRQTGYDLCTTASNHSLDDGWAGLVRTLDALEARGIRPAGTARTATEAAHPPMHTTAAGVRIAVVTGTYDTNGIPRPRNREWSVPDLDPDMLLARAATARSGRLRRRDRPVHLHRGSRRGILGQSGRISADLRERLPAGSPCSGGIRRRGVAGRRGGPGTAIDGSAANPPGSALAGRSRGTGGALTERVRSVPGQGRVSASETSAGSSTR